MFPSSGNFGEAICPFYQHGLCHRPYCHFKHAKPVKKIEHEEATSSASYEKKNVEDDVMKIIKNVSPSKLVEYAKRRQEDKQLRKTLELIEQENRAKQIKEEKKHLKKLNSGLIDAFYNQSKLFKKQSNEENTLNDITLSLKVPGSRTICECDDPDCSGYIEDQEPSTAPTQYEEAIIHKQCVNKKNKKRENINEDQFNDLEEFLAETQKKSKPKKQKLQKLKTLEFFVDPLSSQTSSSKNARKKNRLKVKLDKLHPDNPIKLSDEDSLFADPPENAAVLKSGKPSISDASIWQPKNEQSTVVCGKRKRIAHSTDEVIRSNIVKKSTSLSKKLSYISPSLAAPLIKESAEKAFLSEEVTAPTNYTTNEGVYLGKKRTAHAISPPSSEQVKRPKLPIEIGGKVPQLLRQRYLDKIIDELLPKCKSERQAIEKGFEEESVAYQRCTRKQIYLNLCVNIIKKIRGMPEYMAVNDITVTPMSSSQPIVDIASRIKATSTSGYQKVVATKHPSNGLIKVPSAPLVSAGSSVKKTAFTTSRRSSSEASELTEENLYNHLQQYLLTDKQMWENNYPKRHPENESLVLIKDYVPTNTPLKRLCCRCGKEYYLNKKGKYVTKEECQYHWGKLRKQRLMGSVGMYFSCCQQDPAGHPCSICRLHVCNMVGELTGFVTTENCENEETKQKIFSLDCEMCYTSQGLELTRLTVIDFYLEQIIDLFVKPDYPIVDYNTRFSGVTKEHLQDVTTSLRDVHDILTNLLDKNTILMGHSLESDLKALKLVHRNVVDTALVFPHRLGLPFKRALRNLMGDHLQKIIQDGEGGHDSCEDARACMELMRYKFNEDNKRNARNNTPFVMSPETADKKSTA